MAAETKTWMTAKRLARGPDAANAEMRRWASREKWRRELTHAMRQTFRPAEVYGSAEDMRRDALTSRQRGVGSRVLASVSDHITAADVAVGVAALAGGFLLGRWLIRRRKRAAVEGVEQNPYYVGAIALGAR